MKNVYLHIGLGKAASSKLQKDIFPNIAKFLNISYWSTIAVYKNHKQVSEAIGISNKDEIYSLIKKGI